MIRSSFMVLACIFLFGCLANSLEMPHYSQPSDLHGKAVVIMELNNADAIHLTRYDQNFKQLNRTEYKLRGITKLWSLPLGSYRQVVFVAEPGVYYISKANYVLANTNYNTAGAGLTGRDEVVYGAFEVKSGEVVYLGDLHFNWDKNAPRLIEVKDRTNAVTKDLNASRQYRDLVTKLKVAKFYAPGSKIGVNREGVAQLIG